VFEGLRARLDRFLADHTAPPDERQQAGALQEALIEAKAAVAALREGVGVTERELAAERKQREDAERRGRLAAAVPDPETVAVAERFTAKHRERIEVLERKLGAQRDELVLAERELEEMMVQFRAVRSGIARANSRQGSREASAAARSAGDDPEDSVLEGQLDRAAVEAAAARQLEELKKKMGRK
jgi:hypothetical protein